MSRRHTRRWGLAQIGHSTAPVTQPLVITSVSQTAGKAAGGTVISVTCTGLVGTPTSTLGTVSAVTATSFNITTNAHASGAFSWTATGSNSQVSGAQSFTYLAAPSAPTLNPSNGPQTLTTAGVIFTVATGLPPTGSTGAVISATVDGNAVTSVVWASSTTFTATIPTDTTSGAKDVIVTVDGVTGSTGSSVWTYNPPPIDISATNVSTSGGTGVIGGQNFVTGATASVNINGTPTSLTAAFVNSLQLNFTLAAGTYTASSPPGWPLTITNPDGQSDTKSIFQITAISDPQTILGANLYAWYRSDSGITSSGGLVTQWNDKSANAINLTATAGARPTYNATSANFGGTPPSITFDGVGNFLKTTSAVNLGSNAVFYYLIFRWVAVAASKTTVSMEQTGSRSTIGTSSGSASVATTTNGTTTFTANFATVPNTLARAVYGYNNGTAALVETVGVNVANMTEVTAAGTNAELVSALPMNVFIGAGTAGSGQFSNIEVVECIVANTLPNSTNLNALYTYANLRYGLDSAMTFSRAMSVLATTGTESRIAGGGFNSTTAVKVVVGGSPTAVTATYLNSGSVSLSSIPALAAGSYDLVITNNNSGSSLAISSGLTSTATKQPDTIFGRRLITWARGDAVALNGSGTAVAAYTDLACIGNAIIQNTAADQPLYVAADTNFSSKPTATYTGTPVFMSCASVQMDQGTHTSWMLITSRQLSNAATMAIDSYGDSMQERTGTGSPQLRGQASGPVTTYTNGNVLAQKISMYHSSDDAGGGSVSYALNVNFGTPVTQTAGGTRVSAGTTIFIGATGGASQFYTGSQAEIIQLDGLPSAGQLTDLATYLGRY